MLPLLFAMAMTLEKFDGPLKWEGNERGEHALVTEGGNTFLRSRTIPKAEAIHIHRRIDWDLAEYPYLRWKWRVRKSPTGAKITDSARSDAGAQIYLVWQGFPGHYVIKYFWGGKEDTVGETFKQGNFLVGRLFGVILENRVPGDAWVTEVRNVKEDFLAGFDREPPGKVGALAVLADADETKSEAEADFDDFVVLKDLKAQRIISSDRAAPP